MNRQLRSILEETEGGRRYLAQIDGEKRARALLARLLRLSALSPSRDQGTSDAQIAEWERLANEATPGPWRVLENIPGPRGSLCGVAAEGHDTIENACDGERYIEVMGPLTVGRANGGREWGSGHGSHLARITWPPADECRAQALANAALAAAAREAIPALVALVRSERSQRQESEHYRRVYQEEAEAIARAEWEARVVAAESRATEAERERDEARAEADLYRCDNTGRMTAAEHRAREMAHAAADALARAEAAERRAEAAEAREREVREVLAQVLDAYERRRTWFPLGYEEETAIVEAAQAAASPSRKGDATDAP